MSFLSPLSFYLALNFLIIISVGGFYLISWVKNQIPDLLTFGSFLQIQYMNMGFIFLVLIGSPLLPQSNAFQPIAKFWSFENQRGPGSQYVSQIPNQEKNYITFANSNQTFVFGNQKAITIILVLLLISLSIMAVLFIINLNDLKKLKKDSQLVKRIGKVSILVNDQISVPFSIRTSQAYVFLPQSLVFNRNHFKVSVMHELQHHRQKDTLWIYIFESLRLVCLWNPLIHIWIKKINELQEFACDETLIGRKKVKLQDYSRCLIEVAQNTLEQKRNPLGALGLSFYSKRQILKRRIENMINYSQTRSRSTKWVISLTLGLFLTVSAFAAKSLIQDRRINVTQATNLFEKARTQTEFPLVMNDLVLAELNRYLGTPGGREFMQNSLERMKSYQGMIKGKLNEYQLPEELLAIPIIESGYQNLPQSMNKAWGAGLWMFIVSTAKVYGLQVTDTIDQRLNVDLETDAAMRYIASNNYRFKDLPLALMGYNIGENKVQEGITKFNSRDAWFLTRNGYAGDNYLAKLNATIIIAHLQYALGQEWSLTTQVLCQIAFVWLLLSLYWPDLGTSGSKTNRA